MLTKVIRIDANGPQGIGLQPMDLDSKDFQSPLPVQHVHEYFGDEEAGLSVGVWDTTTMQEAFGPYPGDEFIVVLEGCFAMVNGMGGAVPGSKGQSVCFRNAIPTSWKQDGYLKKVYLTWRDPGAQTPKIASAGGGVIAIDPVPLVEGEPDRIIFTNDTGNMTVSTRRMPVADLAMAATAAHLLVRVVEGQVTILAPDRQADTFADGDIFFLPQGTVCSWSVHTPLSLHQVSLTVPSQA
ncbi:Domain of unknown function DUF861, cupin-3 [Paracoccaceae bacterium]|jgi:uncharacterized cupin superfamily protein